MAARGRQPLDRAAQRAHQRRDLRSIKSFKHIYKGHDCARVRMQTVDDRPQEVLEHDEIRAFQESRYISAPEAYWRLSEHEVR
jgi:hypothetical protein